MLLDVDDVIIMNELLNSDDVCNFESLTLTL